MLFLMYLKVVVYYGVKLFPVHFDTIPAVMCKTLLVANMEWGWV